MDSLNNKDSVGETCVICGNIKSKGIHLYTHFICCDCESEMVSTDTSEEKYKYYLYQLRKVTQPIIEVQ